MFVLELVGYLPTIQKVIYLFNLQVEVLVDSYFRIQFRAKS